MYARVSLLIGGCRARVLRKVVDYMRWKLEAAASAADDVQEFRVEPEIALDMMLAADYLDL